MKFNLVLLYTEADPTELMIGVSVTLLIALIFKLFLVKPINKMINPKEDEKYLNLTQDKLLEYYSNNAQKYISKNHICINNKRLNFTMQSVVDSTALTSYDAKSEAPFTYNMYFSFTAITDNCIYILFDKNKSRSTKLTKQNKYMIQKAHADDVPVTLNLGKQLMRSAANQSYTSKLVDIKSPCILQHSDQIINSIRNYLDVPKYKIVIVFDIKEYFTTDTIYTDFNLINTELNYEVILRPKRNLYFLHNNRRTKCKPGYKSPDKIIGQVLNVIQEKENSDNVQISQEEKDRISNILWSKPNHNLDLNITL